MVALAVMNWLLEWKTAGSHSIRRGPVRILGGLLVSGLLRVYRNMPSVTLDPMAIVTIEWIHLGLAAVMGLVALIALFRKASAYAVWR